MKVLAKFAHTMTDERFLFCSTVLELVRRGYKYKAAKQLFNSSNIAETVKDKYGWMMFHNMGSQDWADWVIAATKRKQSSKSEENYTPPVKAA